MLLRLLLFGVSIFSHRPEIQMQSFPPGGPDIYLLFTSSYIHIPRMAGGVCVHFDCGKGSSSKRIKGFSFMHRGNDKAGWVSAAGASPGSMMGEAGKHLSSPFSGRKLGWLRGRRTRGHSWEDILATMFFLCPLFGPLHVFCPSFPQRKTPVCIVLLLGSSATVE